MAALNGGQPLLYSTHKSLCSERNTCVHFAPICESPVQQQQTINHLVFSSEKLLGENIWQELKLGELVAVDNKMKFLKFSLDLDFTGK
jgi:predicted glutamine amidotransferase